MGVKRAVDLVLDMAQRKGKESIYTYGPLIHNRKPSNCLENVALLPSAALMRLLLVKPALRL
jgi:4-hydroxy-3-methylbut-2-enyl diphosphate reductase IspH